MRDASAEAEVNELDNRVSLIQQDVLELDVSMSDVPLMAVVDALHYLAP